MSSNSHSRTAHVRSGWTPGGCRFLPRGMFPWVASQVAHCLEVPPCWRVESPSSESHWGEPHHIASAGLPPTRVHQCGTRHRRLRRRRRVPLSASVAHLCAPLKLRLFSTAYSMEAWRSQRVLQPSAPVEWWPHVCQLALSSDLVQASSRPATDRCRRGKPRQAPLEHRPRDRAFPWGNYPSWPSAALRQEGPGCRKEVISEHAGEYL